MIDNDESEIVIVHVSSNLVAIDQNQTPSSQDDDISIVHVSKNLVSFDKNGTPSDSIDEISIVYDSKTPVQTSKIAVPQSAALVQQLKTPLQQSGAPVQESKTPVQQLNTPVPESKKDETVITPSPRRLTGYSMSLKKKVIEHALKTNLSSTGRKFKIPRSCIQDWIKKKDEILNHESVKGEAKRIKGAGRPLKNANFDKDLIKWVREQLELNVEVTKFMIKEKARALNTDPMFPASNGWMEKFLLRHNLIANYHMIVSQKPSEP